MIGISATSAWAVTQRANATGPDLLLRVVVHVVLIAVVDRSVDEDLAEEVVAIELHGGSLSETDLTVVAMAIKTPFQPARLVWGCMPCAALGGWSMSGTSSA